MWEGGKGTTCPAMPNAELDGAFSGKVGKCPSPYIRDIPKTCLSSRRKRKKRDRISLSMEGNGKDRRKQKRIGVYAKKACLKSSSSSPPKLLKACLPLILLCVFSFSHGGRGEGGHGMGSSRHGKGTGIRE